MKAKEIILLIFIIVAGVFFYYAQTGKLDITTDFGDVFFWNLEEFTYEEFQLVEPPIPARLHIINAHGKIEIQGTEEEKITIDFQEKIWRKNEEQAKEVSEKLKMVINKDENLLRISTNRSEFRRKNFKTNFKIFIPQGMEVEVENCYGFVNVSKTGKTKINNRHGEIILSEIGGALNVKNSYEDVEIENVQSNCQVESKHSTILVKNVMGEMKIIHRYGKIHLENVSKNVEIESPHTKIFGHGLRGAVEIQNSYEKITLYDVGKTKIQGHHSKVEVDGANGDLKISNSYGNVKLKNIEGNLHIEGKSLNISGSKIVGEEIYISSSYQDTELTEFSAKTTIFVSHGDIVLKPLIINQPIQVKNEYGAIKFFWPKGEKNPFEARANNGEIKWNLPVEISSWEEDHTSIVKAFLQETDKPSVFLSTSYNNIVIEEKSLGVKQEKAEI